MNDYVLFYKEFSDGRIVEVIRMVYNWRIYVRDRDNYFSYDDCWCYQSLTAAQRAFDAWDGQGEPQGWNKHPESGRWRHDGTLESEINQRTHQGPWK